MRVVLVQFGNVTRSGKEYAYKTRFEHEIGDVVVAVTPKQFAIVTVTTVEDISAEQASFASKWIVDVVDVKAHNEYLMENE